MDTSDTKLKDAAQQFEAMLLQQMLKPMQSGENSWDEEKKNDAAFDTISGFGTEAVAGAIAKRGGLGIARQVIRQVTAERMEHH
jgi:peptidoglycan hydrolase FlgJ